MATKSAHGEARVKVVPGDAPPAPEVLAQSIVEISAAMKRLFSTRLTQKTLELLISHSAKVSQRDVRAVLSAIYYLERDYLKPRA